MRTNLLIKGGTKVRVTDHHIIMFGLYIEGHSAVRH